MTADSLPEPLTPSDCDLRGLPFMPLDVVRLCDSDLAALATGDEFKAAVLLWAKSWVQVPAASLPDDPRVLAHLSSAGPRWARVKAMALKGWVKCRDGRLYHPVVAEKAREAWDARTEHRAMKENETERQRRHREDRKRLFATLRERGLTAPWDISMEKLRAMVEQSGGIPPSPDLSQPVTGDGSDPVTPPVTPPVTTCHGDGDAPVTRTATAKTGTGRGTVKEEESFALLSDRGSDAPAPGVDGKTAQPKPRKSVARPEPEGFPAFYAVYPRHEARKDAADAYRQVVDEAGGPEALLAGLRRFRFDPDPKFVPLPASWLRGRRWQDEPRPREVAAAPARALDERFWTLPLGEVRALPRPPVSTPERLAWDEAQQGRRAPHPSTRTTAPIA